MSDKTAARSDVLTDLRDEFYRGPMQHCRSWSDLDMMHERAAREIDGMRKENDNLRALIGAQDTHNCEHDGCMQSELGTNGYRAEAKVWVNKYYAMKRRLEELGESM